MCKKVRSEELCEMTMVMAETTPWNWVTGMATFKHRTAPPRMSMPYSLCASSFSPFSVVPAPRLASGQHLVGHLRQAGSPLSSEKRGRSYINSRSSRGIRQEADKGQAEH